MVDLYKSQGLSYAEYRTSAVYHASNSLPEQIDKVQDRLLRAGGLSRENALFEFNLAPLNARRDMAMLGLIHRCVLGVGPEHFS